MYLNRVIKESVFTPLKFYENVQVAVFPCFNIKFTAAGGELPKADIRCKKS